MTRILQVIKYGWHHAGIRRSDVRGRLKVFLDIIVCFYKYRMWSNQYISEAFDTLTNEQRKIIGSKYLKAGIKRDNWQRDFRENRKFLLKYSGKKYELARLRNKRQKAYSTKFNIGKDLMVEYDVNISRQHYLEGSISIGNNVFLAKHVFIDYSGDVRIGDNVQLTNGVII